MQHLPYVEFKYLKDYKQLLLFIQPVHFKWNKSQHKQMKMAECMQISLYYTKHFWEMIATTYESALRKRPGRQIC